MRIRNYYMKLTLSLLMLLTFNQSFCQVKSDLADLTWLEGEWVGQNETGGDFKEIYTIVNDTLINIVYYFDENVENPSDYGKVYIEDGDIYHTFNESKWILSEKKAGVLKFIPIKNATNQFSWEYIDNSSWKAVLIYEDGNKATFIMKSSD